MAVLYFLLTALVFICLYPFLNVLAYSLSGYNAVLSGDVTFYPIEFTLDAYKQILGRAQIWIAMRVTIFVTLMGTAIGLVLTIFAAYALSRKNLPGKKLLSGLILFTMYFSGGIIPTFLVVKNLGMYDSLSSLYIPQAINVFNFIVMRTFFRQLPESLEEAAKIDAWVVHYSTDYVFPGDGEKPWHETDLTAPLNVYGETKLEGEKALQAHCPKHLIFRTSWVYAGKGNNFANVVTVNCLLKVSTSSVPVYPVAKRAR